MLGVVNKLLKTKSWLTSSSNVLPYCLKESFTPIVWIFTEVEGDGIESRLSSWIFSTLLEVEWATWNSNLERTLQVIYPLRNWKSRVRMFSSIICNVAHIENDIWFFEHLLTSPAQRKYFDLLKSDLIFAFSDLIALKSR